MSKYGMPYKGSKNAIAEWIIGLLPIADTFCDLFCGGCAVTHAAILSGKYKYFIVNDINAKLPKLFIECIQGKHTTQTHTEWISREEFHDKKNEDAYIALCWSFGNNQTDYLYGKNIEQYKQYFHNAVFFDDLRGLESLGLHIVKSNAESLYDRYLNYKKQISKLLSKHEQLQSLERLERLESLERLENKIQIFGIDYQEIYVPNNSVIYCDIPYNNTKCDAYKNFNYDRFYEWTERQNNIFISEYSMPSEFICLAVKEKSVLSTNKGFSGKAQEKIFTNKKTFDNIKRFKL